MSSCMRSALSSGLPESLTLEQIIKIEPNVGKLLERAKNDAGKNKNKLYMKYKNELAWLVGWNSRNKRLRASDTYVTALTALCDVLDY